MVSHFGSYQARGCVLCRSIIPTVHFCIPSNLGRLHSTNAWGWPHPLADVISTRLQLCLDPDLTGPPSDGARYAVRSSEDEIVCLPMFRDALQVAGAGPLHAWINGAWFTSETMDRADRMDG